MFSFDYLVISSIRVPNSKSQVDIPNELRQWLQVLGENPIINCELHPASVTGMVSGKKTPCYTFLINTTKSIGIGLENMPMISKFCTETRILINYFTDVTSQRFGKINGIFGKDHIPLWRLITSFETETWIE